MFGRSFIEAVALSAAGMVLAVVLGVTRGLPGVPSPEEAGACVPTDAATAEVRRVSQREARSLLEQEGVAFVDARPCDEFQAGHVPGSINAPVEDGTLRDEILRELLGARVVVTYCDNADDCSRANRLAGLLGAAGLADVKVLEGGMPEWLQNGYPAEAGICRHCP